ncbi:hypothetical protein SK128_007292, partial [Halocaridina rubra]
MDMVAFGVRPTYDELKNQLLPLELKASGGDQYFFFIVPVQKNDEPNVLLQMAQAQDKTEFTNRSVVATKVNTQDESVFAAEREDMNLDDIFDTPPDDGSDEFNFQVPVIVPMDFHFSYDPATASETLPECQVDSRTWKERVITRIAEKLQLEGTYARNARERQYSRYNKQKQTKETRNIYGQTRLLANNLQNVLSVAGKYTWDHTDLTIRIRLRKDALSSISQSDITTASQLSLYVNTLINLKTLADIRYATVLDGNTTITGGHVSIAAEGLDTYKLIKACITMVNAVKGTVTGGDAVSTALITTQ